MIDQRPGIEGEVRPAGRPASKASRGRRKSEWIAAAAVLLIGLGVVAFLLTRSDGGGKTALPSATSDASTTAAASTTPATSGSTIAPSTSSATTPTTVGTTPTTVAAAATSSTNMPVRWAVFDHGKVYLRGKVPDQATADTLITKAGKVVGPTNVIDEYVVDPTAARPDSAPLYVADTVLFDTGSAVLRPEFTGLLNLGVVLLTQNPKVTVTIIGHTDNVGAADMNMALSQRRVDAAIKYIVGKGINQTRLTGVAKGLTEPVADNSTPEGRRANRRVEFIIIGLLD